VLVAPRLADDLDTVAVLSEAVDERDHACGAGERGAPLLEREIGGDDRRALFVSPADVTTQASVTRRGSDHDGKRGPSTGALRH